MAFLDFCNGASYVPTKSGINQMHGRGKVSLYDAYIPIRKATILQNPGLIPQRIFNHSTQKDDPIDILVTWDDGTIMSMMLDASTNYAGIQGRFPKGLASTPCRATLGYYLRNRMKLFTPTNELSTKIVVLSDFSVSNPGVELTFSNGQWKAKFIY